MSKLIYGVLILLALALQATIFASLSFLPATPDLVLVLVIAFSLFNGPIFGMKFGFFAGLTADLLLGEMIGLSALTKGIVGGFVGLGASNFYKENYFIPFISVVAGTILDQALYLIGLFIFGVSIHWLIALRQFVLPISLVNGFIGILVYLQLYYLNERMANWDDFIRRSG